MDEYYIVPQNDYIIVTEILSKEILEKENNVFSDNTESKIFVTSKKEQLKQKKNKNVNSEELIYMEIISINEKEFAFFKLQKGDVVLVSKEKLVHLPKFENETKDKYAIKKENVIGKVVFK